MYSEPLSLTTLKRLRTDSVFAAGISEWQKKTVKWVAVRLLNGSWGVFTGKDSQSDFEIIDEGNLIVDDNFVRRVVPCDDSAFNLYLKRGGEKSGETT